MNLFRTDKSAFNLNTLIEIQIPNSSLVNLTVYDLNGRTVSRLLQNELSSEFHRVEWDRKDGNNNNVSSGINFYVLRSDEFSAKKKMILLR